MNKCCCFKDRLINHREVKVNLGSGPYGKPDWINLDWGILAILSKFVLLRKLLISLKLLSPSYDISWATKPRLWDCRKNLPFKDESIDFIYSSHFLEHLHRYQVINVLKECKRALKKGGVLRIVLPDLRLIAEKYIQNDKDFFLKVEKSALDNCADLFMLHIHGGDVCSQPSFVRRIQQKFIRGHLWMYDFESLRAILSIAGFSNIQRCEAGKGKTPDIDFLDRYRNNSMFIEAVN